MHEIHFSASRGQGGITLLCTNLALPRRELETQLVHFRLKSALPPVGVYIERIDDAHANAKGCWLEMGRPSDPLPAEVEQLQLASEFSREALPWAFDTGNIWVAVIFPLRGIAAITIELSRAQP